MRAAVNVVHTNWKNIDKNDREMGEGAYLQRQETEGK